MNGQYSAAAPGSGRAEAVQDAVAPLTGEAKISWARLFAALAVSCIFHAALLLAPHLGLSSVAAGGGTQGKPLSAGARLFSATLAPPRRAAPATPAAPSVVNTVVDAVEPLPLPATPPATKLEPGSAAESTLGAGFLPLGAPVFHTADQLTQRPRPLTSPDLEGSAGTSNTPLLGTVILKLWIGETGNIVSVEIEESQVPAAAAAAAAEAFAKLRFAPGEIDGRAVGSIMRIEVTYETRSPELPSAPTPALPSAKNP